MHVFVTGATGFIGFHTVMALIQAGHTVRLGVRNAEKMQKLYAPYDVDISDYVIGEITDAVAVEKALDGCDAVVHTAAIVSLDPSKAERMFYTNLKGTQLVVGGAVAKGIKSIVYVSSAAALYNPNATVLNEETPLSHPRSAYAKSKLQCERYVRSLIKDGASIAMTYPSAVIGPNDPAMSEGNHGLEFMLNYAFMLTSTGQQLIDVRELANAHVKLLEQKKSGRYMVSGFYLPWAELGAMLDKVTGKRLFKISISRYVLMAIGFLIDQIYKIKAFDFPVTSEAVTYATQWVYVDDKKLRDELGIEYRPLEETLADTIKWLAKEKHIRSHWADNIH